MLSLLGTGMYAQFSIGLRGGVNFAKWKWEVKDIEENMNDYQKYMPAPFFALPVEYSLSNNLAIRMEPSYIKQGTRTLLEEEDSYEGGIGKYELDSRMRINYLSLPVMVAGKFSAGKVRFFAMGGPHVGYALNGETKI